MERRGTSAKIHGALEEALSDNSPNLDEDLLVELRLRRERLRQLIRLISAEVRERDARLARARPHCRRRNSQAPSAPATPREGLLLVS